MSTARVRSQRPPVAPATPQQLWQQGPSPKQGSEQSQFLHSTHCMPGSVQSCCEVQLSSPFCR